MEGWANLTEVNGRGFRCRLDAGKNHTLSYTDQAEELLWSVSQALILVAVVSNPVLETFLHFADFKL